MPTPNLCSIGSLACRFRQSPDRLRRQLEAAGIAPEMRLDGVDYYAAAKVGRFDVDGPRTETRSAGSPARRERR